MKNLQQLSGYLKITFKILTFAVPIFICLLWLLIDWPPINDAIKSGSILTPINTPEGSINIASLELTTLTKIIGCLGHVVGSLPYIISFVFLKNLFANYQKNKIFTSSNTQIYKKLGWLAFINGILFIPITQTIMVLAATVSNPPGHRYISLGFGTPSLQAVLCGLLIIVIALVMQEAQSLQEENQLTV